MPSTPKKLPKLPSKTPEASFKFTCPNAPGCQRKFKAEGHVRYHLKYCKVTPILAPPPMGTNFPQTLYVELPYEPNTAFEGYPTLDVSDFVPKHVAIYELKAVMALEAK